MKKVKVKGTLHSEGVTKEVEIETREEKIND